MKMGQEQCSLSSKENIWVCVDCHGHASVLKLDHLDHGKCGVLRRYYWYRDGEDGV